MLSVVSFRLPVTFDPTTEEWVGSPGGLVTAMRPALAGCDATWYGHSGTGSMRVPPLGPTRMVGLPGDLVSMRSFYEGYCNRALWPALHGLGQYVEELADQWDEYVAVNTQVASFIASHCIPGTLIWVHDYHYLMVPQLLRRLRHDVRVGLFLHTAVSGAGLRGLRSAQHLAPALAAADVIGCQTARDQMALTTFVEGQPGRPKVEVHPVGIDIDRWSGFRDSRSVTRDAAQWTAAPGRLLVGADRLDYIKGIPQRLLAFESLLSSGELDADSVRLVQIALPSRERIAVYGQLRGLVDETITRLNESFPRHDRMPVVELVEHQLDPAELAALYRAADVLLVTSLRDGMNLVAAEFATVNADRPSGIILSTGAGIHDRLGRAAFSVDGASVLSIADGLRAALAAPSYELAARAALAGRLLNRCDAAAWGAALFSRLGHSSNDLRHHGGRDRQTQLSSPTNG